MKLIKAIKNCPIFDHVDACMKFLVCKKKFLGGERNHKYPTWHENELSLYCAPFPKH